MVQRGWRPLQQWRRGKGPRAVIVSMFIHALHLRRRQVRGKVERVDPEPSLGCAERWGQIPQQSPVLRRLVGLPEQMPPELRYLHVFLVVPQPFYHVFLGWAVCWQWLL
jgi:hypothetical protein